MSFALPAYRSFLPHTEILKGQLYYPILGHVKLFLRVR